MTSAAATISHRASIHRADPSPAAPLITPDDADLRALASGDSTLLELADDAGVDLDDLARTLTAESSPTRAALERLAEAHTLLLPAVLGRAKLIAARRLRELADDDDHPETARKACVDLLKISPATAIGAAPAAPRPANRADPDSTIAAEAHTAVRDLMESLGAGSDPSRASNPS